ncbi:condensin complex subunit 1-like [Clytia hemisphaerica]|uniref:Condensin complex subunit 1 n=1 Tax=Clytia hemisphaerica TaxID=252671 RepID=A0A7M5UQR8_9CNID
MDCDFVLPLNKEDLLSNRAADGYGVRKIYEPAKLGEKLEDCNIDYRNDGPTAILKQFDVFYSVLHHLTRLQEEIKQQAWEMVLQNVTIHMNSLPMILDPEGMDIELRKSHLNTVKMEIYILTQLIEEFESEAAKPDMNTDITKRGKGSKKKSHQSWDWSKERSQVLSVINQFLQLELQRLWDPPIVEEEFANLFSSVCYKMLENPVVVRQKEDKELVINILGQLIKRYKHQLGASMKMIQLLQHFEHLVSPLAQAITTFVTDFGAKNLVSDVIREIGRMESSDLSRDTSGTRAFSQFLVELADKIPNQVLPNISLLMAHLDGDSYTMRNGVLGVFGEIVIKVLSKEDLDESMKKSRESFLDKLEEHIHDVHAFVRSKDLQIWLRLCQEKAIPISRQSRIIELILGRLLDKSSQVRKYAVQFLKASLIGNPFAAKLPIEQLTSSLEKETDKLKEMDTSSQNEDNAPSNELDREWSELETVLWKELTKTSDEEETSGDEEMEEDQGEDEEAFQIYEDDEDGLDKALLKVQGFLKEKLHDKAIKMLSRVLEVWGDVEELQVSDEDVQKMMESSDEVEEDEDEEDSEETEDKQSREKKLKKKLFLLKKVYCLNASGNDMEIDLDAVTQQQPTEEQILKNTQLEQQKVLVNYLKDCVNFAHQMRRAIPILCQHLGSKTNSDVLETMDFFIAAHEFGLAHSEEGIRRMANLVWSRDPIVKKAVVTAFERLYLDIACDNPRNKPTLIVNSLTSLITSANLGELTSLEELLCELMKQDLIPQNVVQLLWQRFALKLPQTTEKEQRGALNILSMVAGAEKDIIKSNLSVLVEHGLKYKSNFLLARDTCNAILKIKEKQKLGENKEPFRLPTEHGVFVQLESMILEGLAQLNDMTWVPFSEDAISVIYQLAEQPDVITGRLLKALVQTLFGGPPTNDQPLQQDEDDVFPKQSSQAPPSSSQQNNKTHPRVVARVLSIAGYIALMHLYHLDVSILSELKRRHNIQEEEKERKGKKNGKTPGGSRRKSGARDSSIHKDSGLDDEMGVGGAAAEDAEAEYIRKICEREIVTGDNLLSVFAPVAVMICKNPSAYKNAELRSSAALALSRFMMVSSEFCDQHLQLVFTILEKSEFAIVRSNMMITLGDLCFRFPNLIEPWTPNLYARLRDESVEVRKTAVTILTHLILNDMLKVKGQISEMAICLEDKEDKIASSAKSLFAELARKGNALYNIAPDIISRLSDPDTGVDESVFRTIMKYILQFIQKDKQAESLVEKLCHRFRATRTDRQWRDLSFCLSLLPYTEKTFKKLMENIRCYHDKLSDDDVYSCFTTIISKSKKFSKQEFKTLVEEFESTIEGYHNKGVEENADFDKAAKVLSQAATQENTTKNRKKSTRTARKPKPWEVNDSEEDVETNDNEPPKHPSRKSTRNVSKKTTKDKSDDDFSDKENRKALPGGKRKTTEKKRKTVRLNPVFSSDEEDLFT